MLAGQILVAQNLVEQIKESAMGAVNATIGIWASDGAYLRSLRMPVDTGAAYSQLPAELLYDLGWQPTQPPRPARLADGTATTVALGEVKIRYNEADLTRLFVFGEDGCTPLLGSDTLQGLGLGVDPVNHRLIPVVAHR